MGLWAVMTTGFMRKSPLIFALPLSEYLVKQNCLTETDLVRDISNKWYDMYFLKWVLVGVFISLHFHINITNLISRILGKEFSYKAIL